MPVSVLLNADVMRQISLNMVAGTGDESVRGRESGGILLGSVDETARPRPVVRIEAIELFESRHARGQSFVLTDREKRTLGRRLARWNRRRPANLRPVGFYRTHTRRGLYLDNDDLALIQSYFPERDSVVLLVRPERVSSHVGGFFFWQEGDMRRESCYHEFPFDPSRLPLVHPPAAPPPPPPPEPEPLSLGRRWLWPAVAAAGVLLIGVSVASVRKLTFVRADKASQATVAMNRSAPPRPMPASLSTAPVPIPDDKPSPFAPKRVAPAPVPLPPIRPAAKAPDPAPVEPTVVAVGDPAPAPPPPVVPAVVTPPPIEESVQPLLPRPRSTVATVTVEPVTDSKLGRFVGKIPGLRRLEKNKRGFVPARPIHEVAPSVPSSRELEHETPVDLRVTVDPAGNVASVETARNADKSLARLAADAARNWRFEPARRNEETVSSELILHFTFRP